MNSSHNNPTTKKYLLKPFSSIRSLGKKMLPKKFPVKKKILVADDDEMTLAMTNLYLTNVGYEVMPAKDSLEAIKLIKDFKPDLLVLDILMPFMTGLELLNYIRYEFMVNTPVVMMSVMGNSEIKEAAGKLGVLSYITKPFDMDELVKLIQKIPGFK